MEVESDLSFSLVCNEEIEFIQFYLERKIVAIAPINGLYDIDELNDFIDSLSVFVSEDVEVEIDWCKYLKDQSLVSHGCISLIDDKNSKSLSILVYSDPKILLSLVCQKRIEISSWRFALYRLLESVQERLIK